MENEAITLMTPMLQYGFAFFSLVLVVILFFVIKWLLAEVKASRLAREGLLDQTKLVIQNNTHAIEQLAEKMALRPCLLPQASRQPRGIDGVVP